MKSGIKEIVGKTIKGVIVSNSHFSNTRVFLVFSDNTYYELYEFQSKIVGAGGVDKGGMKEARNYALEGASNSIELEYCKDAQHISGKNKPKQVNTLLCVDDDELTAEAISNYFIKQGYKTFTAFSAEEALEVLSKHHIDLVMTDVVMPGMDGLELTKIIKKNYDSHVIIFTGYKPSCSYEKAISLGASDFLYKPFKFKDLLDSVRRILSASK